MAEDIGGVVSEGSLPAYVHAEAQSAGLFLRMPLKELEAAKQGSPAVRSFFVRYSDCLLAQSFSLWLATPHTPFSNVRLNGCSPPWIVRARRGSL
jgi:hypothetical protein